MLTSPKITWDGDVATIEVWIEGDENLSFTVVYDCKNRERIRKINPKEIISSAGHMAEICVQRAYDNGKKLDHIEWFCWF